MFSLEVAPNTQPEAQMNKVPLHSCLQGSWGLLDSHEMLHSEKGNVFFELAASSAAHLAGL